MFRKISAWILKKSFDNYCFFCGKRSRFAIAVFKDSSEVPICQKCSSACIKRLRFRKSMSVYQLVAKESKKTQLHTQKNKQMPMLRAKSNEQQEVLAI